MMLINMAPKGNVNVKNLVQTIVQHLAFPETNNSILKAYNQEQSTYIVLRGDTHIMSTSKGVGG